MKVQQAKRLEKLEAQLGIVDEEAEASRIARELKVQEARAYFYNLLAEAGEEKRTGIIDGPYTLAAESVFEKVRPSLTQATWR